MPDINFVNPNINKIKNQEISIQVSLDGFSFSIASAVDKSCLLFRSYKFEHILLIDELIRKTESILSSDDKLNYNFDKADVTLISQNSAIIPTEFFNTSDLKKYFEFSHNLAEFDEIHYTHLKEIEAYNVFSIPGYFSQLFYSNYPKVTFNHQASRLINFGYKNQSYSPRIIVGLNAGFFDMVIFDNNKLLLSNSYLYTTPTDFIYFFLYTCRQLKIEIEKTNVYAFGESILNRVLIEEIAGQVNEVIITDLNSPYACTNLTKKQLAQYYNHFIQN